MIPHFLVISLLHVSTGTETVLWECVKTIMRSGNYEKEGDCFGRLRERKLIRLACIQLLFFTIFMQFSWKKRLYKNKRRFDVFERYWLRSTSARQTHINTTERYYCLLITRVRRITKCLRNDKHALACEQALHLGESRDVTREPHAKGNAGPKGGGKKRPQDNNCYWPLILKKNGKRWTFSRVSKLQNGRHQLLYISFSFFFRFLACARVLLWRLAIALEQMLPAGGRHK